MDILRLIKQRRTIRRYNNNPVPRRIINKIMEAGIWGPSVPSFLRIQPWKFVVVTEKKAIQKISRIAKEKSKGSPAGVNILLHSAADIINSAQAVVLIYNSGDMEKLKGRFKSVYQSFSGIIKDAVLSAISAAIQNMILMAENLGVGSCWLDTPLFCEEEINRFIKAQEKLVGVLTLGYPAEEGRRAPRKAVSETLRYIE